MGNRKVFLVQDADGATIPFERAEKSQLNGEGAFRYHRVITRKGKVEKVVTAEQLRELSQKLGLLQMVQDGV